MLNTVALMGRLTADAELKTTQSGIAVCSFTIACDRSYAKAGEERACDFINIVAWRQTAEFVCKYFHKGSLIALDGSIQTRNYEDKSGNKRTAFEIVANNVHFAGAKGDTAAQTAPQATMPRVANAPAQTSMTPQARSFEPVQNDDFTVINDDEDLPF
ncbi:MAG: single-stranded DNA-binding protein [Oscillospiraceae bacterium]